MRRLPPFSQFAPRLRSQSSRANPGVGFAPNKKTWESVMLQRLRRITAVLAAALTFAAASVPTTVQAQGYYGYGPGYAGAGWGRGWGGGPYYGGGYRAAGWGGGGCGCCCRVVLPPPPPPPPPCCCCGGGGVRWGGGYGGWDGG